MKVTLLQALAFRGQGEHPLEDREFAIDDGGHRRRFETLDAILRHVCAGELDGAARSEVGEETRQAELKTIG